MKECLFNTIKREKNNDISKVELRVVLNKGFITF